MFGVVVNELNSVCRSRHPEIHVEFFEHVRVLMRRPAGPIARLRNRKAGNQSSCFNIFCEQHMQLSFAARPARGEL